MKPISFIAGNKSRLLLLAAVATGVLGMQAGRGTMAYFTTQVTSDHNAFTAGTLTFNISDTAVGLDTATVADSSITFSSNMKPGDSVYAPIEIDNVGSLDGKYGITYTTSTVGGTNLAPGLSLAIMQQGTAAGGSGTAGATTKADCTSTNFANPLIWQASPRALGPMLSAGQTVVDVTTGAALPVVHATHDILCMKVVFTEPTTPVNTYNDGLSDTTVLFTFDGLVSAAPVTIN